MAGLLAPINVTQASINKDHGPINKPPTPLQKLHALNRLSTLNKPVNAATFGTSLEERIAAEHHRKRRRSTILAAED